MGREVIDIGNVVLCDICNEDWTNREESGGVLLGNNAVCPDCSKKDFVGEKPNKRCPPFMSFANWVRQDLRGGESGKIEFLTGDDFMSAFFGKW